MPISPKITVSELAEVLSITPQAIHKKIKKLGIQPKKQQNKLYLTHTDVRQILSTNSVKPYKISTSVVKGGVGKTTIAEALSIGASLLGAKVMIIDLDQQANITKGFGMSEAARQTPIMIDIVSKTANPHESIIHEAVPGIDLVPSRLDNVTLDNYLTVNRVNPIKLFDRLFGDLFHDYDLVIFDCPPTLGAVVCSAMVVSDIVLSPLNPDVYSYEGIEIMSKEVNQTKEEFGLNNIEWRILLNKFDSRTILSTDYISQIIQSEKYSSKLLRSVVRTSQDFPNSKNKERSIFDSLKKSTAKEDVLCLVNEIIFGFSGITFNVDRNK